jgi:hypothetical protein
VALPALASLQRRRRQLETLRKMLEGVDQLIAMVRELEANRELTADEGDELARLLVRRVRIEQSISEAGG